MKAFVRFTVALLIVSIACHPARTSADTVYVPGPRIEIPALSPQVSAAISARRQATHFVRRDDGPLYLIYGAHAKTPPFPNDLTPARGRAYIDGFARVAPSMHCRTDDVADAYEFLLQAALLAFNGTHFSSNVPGPVIACTIQSFGATALDSVAHIYLGGDPGFTRLSDRQKQAVYETLIVVGGYLLDNVSRAKTGSSEMTKARSDAADVVRSLTGFRASRVHLGDSGVWISDQAR
jgi:hypothetical protein